MRRFVENPEYPVSLHTGCSSYTGPTFPKGSKLLEWPREDMNLGVILRPHPTLSLIYVTTWSWGRGDSWRL